MSEGLYLTMSALIKRNSSLAVFKLGAFCLDSWACDFVPILGPFSNKKVMGCVVCLSWFAVDVFCANPFLTSCFMRVYFGVHFFSFPKFLFFLSFFLSPLSGVRHPGEPAGRKSGGGLHYIWEQVRQLPEVHGVQRAGLSELQAAEAGGFGSTRRPHCPLPAAPWSVTTCRKLRCRGR